MKRIFALLLSACCLTSASEFNQAQQLFLLCVRNTPPTPPLPYDYAVEYIETDGVSSYINTGIPANQTFGLQIECAFATLSTLPQDTTQGGTMFGARGTLNYATGRRFSMLGNTRNSCFVSNYPSTSNDSPDMPLDTNRHIITMAHDSISFDGVSRYVRLTASSGFGEDFCLGKAGVLTASSYPERDFAPVRIYSCVLSENGSVVFNGIPVVANGVAGIYDSISGTVKTNAAATGTITAGPRRAQ